MCCVASSSSLTADELQDSDNTKEVATTAPVIRTRTPNNGSAENARQWISCNDAIKEAAARTDRLTAVLRDLAARHAIA